MALDSLEIDAQLDKAVKQINQFKEEFSAIKQRSAIVISKLSQFDTDYQKLVDSVAALSGSNNPVDQLQVAKLAKITAAVGALSMDFQAAKAAIDALGI